ncbi:MAG: ArnT family glycosyltransferase, partial [Planctomycetota bacterium]
RPAFALALGCLAAWLPTLSGRDLWAPNEPRFAEIAREMVERGDYLVPHLNGEVYPDKPPLFFWLEVASARALGGFSEFALRLPSALAGTALVLLTYRIGLHLFGRRAAFLAGAFLATAKLFPEQSTRAVVDPLFSLCVAAGMLVYLRARGRWGPLAGAHFGLWWGLSILSKGYGLLLPALPAALEALLRVRRRGEPRSPFFGRPLLGILASVLVAALVAGAWFLPALRRDGHPLTFSESVGKQVVGRILAPWNHEQPLWYFLLTFPVEFLPWTPFLLLAIPSLRRPAPDGDGVRLASVWFFATLVLFSLIPSKRGIYLLPAFPAAALLLGRTVGRLCEGREQAHAWARAAEVFGKALSFLGCLLLLLVPLALRRLPAMGAPEVGAGFLALPGACLLGLGALALHAFRSGGFARFFLLTPAAFAAATTLLLAVLFPRFDSMKSSAPLARDLLRLHRGEPVVCLRVPPEGLRFYSGIPAVAVEGEEAFLQRLSGVFPALGVTTEGVYRKLRPKLPEGIEALLGDTIGHRTAVVLGRPRS